MQDCNNIQDTINYLQVAVFSPVKTTFVQAIKHGNVALWPGLTVEDVNKHYKCKVATAKGHMTQTRHNTRSTRPKPILEEEIDAAVTVAKYAAPTDVLHQRSHEVYGIITELDGKVYMDLTGWFPTTSSKWRRYMSILYDYDGNAILVEPMKSRADAEAVQEYTVLYKQLTDAGLHPKFQMMDNEASTAVKEFLCKNNIKHQLVPPPYP
jgi:hypothetical protein